MLYAIVSDLHANPVAWNAVLADLSAIGAARIVCLGDVVGYGPDPAGVLESVYRHVDAFVMGNHDAVVAGKMSPECFNDHARRMVEWSAARISARGRAFLGRQPLVLDAPAFACVHGSPCRPAAFDYVISPDEALAAFGATDRQLVFVGHTHQPGIAVLGASGVAHMLPGQDFELERGKRYIVNAGSVGDPRDDDPRASYCLFDDATGTIQFRRVAFDYAALAAGVRAAGLEPGDIPLLRRDPVPRREPVRETLGFAPPSDRAAMARGVAEHAEIESLGRANRRLRAAVAALAVALSALAGAYFGRASRPAGTGFVPESPLPPVESIVPRDILGPILPQFSGEEGPVPASGAVAGWRYSLSDPRRQRLSLVRGAEGGALAVMVENAGRLPFVLEAPPWRHNGLATGRRLHVELMAKASADFVGDAAFRITANPGGRGERLLMREGLLLTNPGAVQPTRRTMEKKSPLRVADGDVDIAFRIEADFSGALTIWPPALSAVE